MMTSSKMPENAQELSGDGSDELKSEESKPAPEKNSVDLSSEDELEQSKDEGIGDESEESEDEENQLISDESPAQSPGHELAEPHPIGEEESESIVAGDSAKQCSEDELEDKEDEHILEEENAEQFSGHELAELQPTGDEETESIVAEESVEQSSEDELEESEHEKSESIPETDNRKSPERKSRGKWVFVFIALALCLLAGIGYLYMRGEKSPITTHQKEKPAPINQLGIPKDQLLIFDSFVIPFEENERFTYISLSISFNLPNKEVKGEMIEKKHQLRGIIYDLLRDEVNKTREVPPIEKLKEVVIRGVNTGLSTGEVNEVYITEFLAL